MAEEQVGVINLGSKEISPDEEAAYREKIRAAKANNPLSALKGQEVVGSVPRPQMPMLQHRPQSTASAPPDQGVVPRGPNAPVLRPETKEQLQAALQAGKQQAEAAQQQSEATDLKAQEEARLQALFEGFDFDGGRNQADKILDNKKRRKEIEERCAPMDFEDLLMQDEVTQKVPILPGKFEPRFRSLRPIETLYLKQRMAKETVQTDQYLGEKYNLMLLCCSLVDINGAPLPDHRRHSQTGFEVEDKLFNEKLAALMQKSAYIIADLSVNYIWFDLRVRRLLNPDALGNG